MDIEANARNHGVTDDDMLHAPTTSLASLRDADVTMFIGPSSAGAPLEVGVATDDDGTAVIHAMPARTKFLEGWWTP